MTELSLVGKEAEARPRHGGNRVTNEPTQLLIEISPAIPLRVVGLRNDTGLYIGERSWILRKLFRWALTRAKRRYERIEITLKAYRLARPATEAEIRSALQPNYAFTELQANTCIQQLIDRQVLEPEKSLLSKATRNVFFTKHALLLYIYFGKDDWFVDSEESNTGKWEIGAIIFAHT